MFGRFAKFCDYHVMYKSKVRVVEVVISGELSHVK